MLGYKAGLNEDKKVEIEKIIDNLTKNSKFNVNKSRKKKRLEKSTQKIKESFDKMDGSIIEKCTVEADEIYSKIRLVFEQSVKHRLVYAHFDMDAFYAQVETLDNPHYASLPVAVGSISMLATSNYPARKYGVRSAMPGHIALKLCPNLIIVPPNFEKYKQKSKEIHDILRKYSPELISTGLDEAYMNLTQFCTYHDNWIDKVSEFITTIKSEIYTSTHLTCSVGVSFSRQLSKICSQINKPNGCYVLLQDKLNDRSILDFVDSCRVGKLCGIGEVTEQKLLATNVKICRDIYNYRAQILNIFGIRTARWLFFCSFGLDEDKTETTHNQSKQTIGIERTFEPSSNSTFLYDMIDKLSESVQDLLKGESLMTDNITLKIKYEDFSVITRAKTLLQASDSKEVIKNVSKTLFNKEYLKNTSFKIRLIGIRVNKRSYKTPDTSVSSKCSTLDDYFSEEYIEMTRSNQVVPCPVCGVDIINNDKKINDHIDMCLQSNQA